jgi:transcriptional activator SPT7
MSAPPPVLGMPLIPPPLGVPVPGLEPMSGLTPGPTLLILPDDGLPSSQTKLGPIGQVLKSGQSTGAVKKKAKATGAAPKDIGGGPILPLPPGLLTLKPEDVSMEPLTTTTTTTPFDAGAGDVGRRGAKGALPGGNGNHGAKKKAVDFPPVIVASA